MMTLLQRIGRPRNVNASPANGGMRHARRVVVTVTLSAFTMVIGACSSNKQEISRGGKVNVVVGIPPQKFLVEQIGGEDVSVATLVSPGQSSHTFEPTPHQTSELANARLFFRTGEPFEDALVAKIASSFPTISVVDLREGIALREHGHAHDDESSGDPHIYLSPALLKVQARTVYKHLSNVCPDKKPVFEKRLERLTRVLDSLDSEIRDLLAQFKGDTIIVYHSAFGYFTEEYGLVQIAVEREGKEPGAKDLGEMIELSRRLNAKTIFAQPQYSSKYAETVAHAVGASVVYLNPLSEDVIANLRHIAESFRAELASRQSNLQTKRGE